MPFKVPSEIQGRNRWMIYYLFDIGKTTNWLWVRRVKAFFTFRWKVTPQAIKNCIKDDKADRERVLSTLAANPRWLAKDLNFTTELYSALQNLPEEAKQPFLDCLRQAVKVDRLVRAFHGKEEAKKAACTVIEEFDLEKEKLEEVLSQGVLQGEVSLIEELAKTHKELNWQGALDRAAKSPKRGPLVRAIVSQISITELFESGKQLAAWLQEQKPEIRALLIPYIGDLRKGFVKALESKGAVIQYIEIAYTPSEGEVSSASLDVLITNLRQGHLKECRQTLENALGVRYVLEHWDQLENEERHQYLSGEFQVIDQKDEISKKFYKL